MFPASIPSKDPSPPTGQSKAQMRQETLRDQDGPRENGERERETERGRGERKLLRDTHTETKPGRKRAEDGVCVKVPRGFTPLTGGAV